MTTEWHCGFAAIDKPAGVSSASVVAAVKRSFGGARCGHSGTLDPAASGLLVVAVGAATRLISFLPERKRYLVGVRFGYGTDTLDMEGKIVERAPIPTDLPDRLAEALPFFTGEIMQKAPAHSALKHKGRPLYEYARRGQPAPEKVRRVWIYDISLVRAPVDVEALLDVSCGPGTYMRSLARDIAHRIGCTAVMSSLVRTECNGLALSAARPPPLPSDEPPVLIGVDAMLSCLPSAQLCAEDAHRLVCGCAVSHPMAATDAVLAWGPGETVLGVVRASGGMLKPLRIVTQQVEQVAGSV